MSRVLLVDDSPHAQRMGERILSEEGFEVVTVSNADSALIRLDDVDPDVVLADTVMPGRTGYEICQFLKMSPRHKHVRVILTAGVLENFDEELLKRVEADGTLKKPFEATALVAAVKPLAEAATAARADRPGAGAASKPKAPAAIAPFVAVVDSEQVKAAVAVALDGAMETMVEEITRRVLTALQAKPPAAEPEAARVEPLKTESKPAAAPSSSSDAPPIMETVRRVNTLRVRSTSILGLELDAPSQRPPAASE
jgi:CheY-like chemotaxis protein